MAAAAGLALAAMAIQQVLDQSPKDEPATPEPTPSHTFDPLPEPAPQQPAPQQAAPAPRSSSLKVFPTVGGSIQGLRSSAPVRPQARLASEPMRPTADPDLQRSGPQRAGLMRLAPSDVSATQARDGDSWSAPITQIAQYAQTETTTNAADSEAITQQPTAKVSCIRRRISNVATTGLPRDRDN